MDSECIIRFGSRALQLDLEGAHVALPSVTKAKAAVSARNAVQEALASPLGYPPLTDALLPSDQIVIAVDWGVPQLPEVLGGVLATLDNAGVAKEAVCVLLADATDQIEPLLANAPTGWESVATLVHDGSDRDALGYLAANKSGDPVYFNRAILDADFVLPLGVARAEASLGNFGIFSSLFPAFIDTATATQLASGDGLLWDGRQKSRQKADEAGWLLGARFTVQVAPARGGGIERVIAGDIDSVSAESQRALATTWESTFEAESHLVVACVGGSESQQKWGNVARALDAAMRLSRDDGTILVCCDIATAPARALALLANDEEDFYESADATSSEAEFPEGPGGDRCDSPELMFAGWLRLARENHRVYLMSALDEDDVSGLGCIHVSNEHEVANLIRRHDSCVILNDAQHAQPRLRAEVPAN